jgi:hypothetical protein
MEPTSMIAAQLGAQAMNTGSNFLGELFFGKRNQDFAANQATLAYRRQVAQWNRENEYNSPTMQMQRLKNAGLNPHLVYGSGSAANVSNGLSNVSEGRANMRFSAGKPLDVVNAMRGSQDIKVGQATVNNLESMALLNNQRALTEIIEQELRQLNIENTRYNLERNKRFEPYQKEALELENKFKVESIQNAIKAREIQHKQLQVMDADIGLKGSQSSLNSRQKTWLDEKINEFRISGINIDKDSYLLRGLTKIAESIGGRVGNEPAQEWITTGKYKWKNGKMLREFINVKTKRIVWSGNQPKF